MSDQSEILKETKILVNKLMRVRPPPGVGAQVRRLSRMIAEMEAPPSKKIKKKKSEPEIVAT